MVPKGTMAASRGQMKPSPLHYYAYEAYQKEPAWQREAYMYRSMLPPELHALYHFR